MNPTSAALSVRKKEGRAGQKRRRESPQHLSKQLRAENESRAQRERGKKNDTAVVKTIASICGDLHVFNLKAFTKQNNCRDLWANKLHSTSITTFVKKHKLKTRQRSNIPEYPFFQ